MSDPKYPQPPIDPNITTVTGKLNRPMNAMERAIAAQFDKDPRLDNTAKKSVAALYPDTPDGLTGEESVEFDPQVDGVAKKAISALDDLRTSEAMSWAKNNELRPLGDPLLGTGGVQSTNPATTHDEAARLAQEMFGDEGLTPVDKLDLAFATGKTPVTSEKEPEKEEPEKEEPEEAKPIWPEELPRAIKDFPDMVKVLDFYNLDEEQVLHMILAQEKPLSQEAKKTMWEKEIEMAGLSEEEVNTAIHEFLSRGYIEKTFSIHNDMLKFTMRTRTIDDEKALDLAMTAAIQQAGGSLVLSLEERIRFTWKIAGSIHSFVGLGKEVEFEGVSRDERVEWVNNLPGITFQTLSQAVLVIDNLAYFAAQKTSIENF